MVISGHFLLVVGHCRSFQGVPYLSKYQRSTADLLTVETDRIARTFNRTGGTQPVALDISKAFDRFFFFKFGFTPCKAEQPLQCLELQEKETQKD